MENVEALGAVGTPDSKTKSESEMDAFITESMSR